MRAGASVTLLASAGLVLTLAAVGCRPLALPPSTHAGAAAPDTQVPTRESGEPATVAPTMTGWLVVLESDLRTSTVVLPRWSPEPTASAVPTMLADQPVATATFTTVPTPTGTAKPATKAPTIPAPPTPTPLFVLLSDKTALARYIRPTRTPYPELTAMPPGLVGKIGFRSNMLGATDRTYVVDPDGSGLAYLTVPWCYNAALAFEGTAPQGGARVLQAKGRHGLDLFLLLDNGSRQQLTFVGAGKAYDAAWSPSGDRVVFASNQEGDDDIFCVVIQSLDDPRPRTFKVTFDTWESDKHPSFSPDGAQIVYYSNATGRRQLWIASATGEGVPRLLDLEGECWNPVWFK